MIWSHVSTEVEYRNPLGALRTGEAVRLSLAAVSTEPKKEAYEVRMKLEGVRAYTDSQGRRQHGKQR